MPNSPRIAAASLMVLALAPPLAAEERRNWLLVESPYSQDVQVIDPETREVARIKVGKGPKRVAFSIE